MSEDVDVWLPWSPSDWDATRPRAFLGDAGGDFAEWHDLAEKLARWSADAGQYIKELNALSDQMRRIEDYGANMRFKVVRGVVRPAADASVAVTVLPDPTGWLASLFTIFGGLNRVYAAMFPLTRDRVDKTAARLIAIRQRIDKCLDTYDQYLGWASNPPERMAQEVDAIAHLLPEARGIQESIEHLFLEAAVERNGRAS